MPCLAADSRYRPASRRSVLACPDARRRRRARRRSRLDRVPPDQVALESAAVRRKSSAIRAFGLRPALIHALALPEWSFGRMSRAPILPISGCLFVIGNLSPWCHRGDGRTCCTRPPSPGGDSFQGRECVMFAMPWMALAVRGRDRIRRAGLLAVALAVAGVLVAGCWGGSADPGVAGVSSATPSPSQSATVSGEAEAEALQYAACMRSHGVPDFPDPTVQNGSGGVRQT